MLSLVLNPRCVDSLRAHVQTSSASRKESGGTCDLPPLNPDDTDTRQSGAPAGVRGDRPVYQSILVE